MLEMNEYKAYYWLSLSGMTAKRIRAVLSVFSAVELWNVFTKDKRLKKIIGEKYYNELIKYHKIEILDNMLYNVNKLGVRILTLAHPSYPADLKQEEVSPPIILYCKGDLSVLQKPCVSVVGTRMVSNYGKEVCASFCKDLAVNGVTVVSGLASGVDETAHKAALDYGSTVAVLGCGFNKINPYSQKLFKRIIDEGSLVVTEYNPDFNATRYSFPERNRIISGLSKAVIVIEAGEKSGALITADFALEQNRGVYAVPGNINSTKSVGCNKLINESSANIAFSAQQILKDLRLKTTQSAKKTTNFSLDFLEEKIYNLLQCGQAHLDEIIEKTNISANEILPILFNLELKGIIKKFSGNYFALNNIN